MHHKEGRNSFSGVLVVLLPLNLSMVSHLQSKSQSTHICKTLQFHASPHPLFLSDVSYYYGSTSSLTPAVLTISCYFLYISRLCTYPIPIFLQHFSPHFYLVYSISSLSLCSKIYLLMSSSLPISPKVLTLPHQHFPVLPFHSHSCPFRKVLYRTYNHLFIFYLHHL